MMTIDGIFAQLNGLIERREWDKVEPFLTGCMENASELKNYGIYITIGNELLDFYRETGQFEKALNLSEDILLLMEELQLEETEHFATVMINVAAVCQAAGRGEEAYRYDVRALKIYEQALSGGDIRFIRLYQNMSMLLESRNEFEEAAMLLEKAASILENKPEEKEQRADLLTSAALLRFKQEKYEEGEELLKLALSLYEASGNLPGEAEDGEELHCAHYSAALSGLGEAAFRREDYETALAFYEKAASVSASTFGESEGTRLLRENCAAIVQLLHSDCQNPS